MTPSKSAFSVPAVVIDTNVFIAAAFNPTSDSGRILEAVAAGELRLIWDEPTRRETEALIRRIPPISWEGVRHLFVEANRCSVERKPDDFASVPDPEDRKFAALASSSRATLITLDRHLLGAGLGGICRVRTPRDFLQRLRDQGSDRGRS